MIELADIKEQVILLAVSKGDNDDTESSLNELEELVKTAGAETICKVIQNRERVHNTSYLGTGKLIEVKELIAMYDATGVVCDDELSPVQLRTLEEVLDTKVMDRTMVILDIFAMRAMSREGKLQVELAQLRYRAARLVGIRSSLSRLGGGIGTRGPGEKKLEMDRRLIHERISSLKAELEEVKRHREVMRQKRSKNYIPVAAIVGYTNAGKSSLLNRLTDADVLSEDKLFATLDPTTRNYVLEDGQEILLTDTVGFIRKLPHHLIEAFKSTLEEAKYADIIIHVVDSSNPDMDLNMHVVYQTLSDLGVTDKPIITLFNKCDLTESTGFKDFMADESIIGSVKTGEGMDELSDKLSKLLKARRIYIERFYRYNEAGTIQLIRKYGQLLSEEYKEEGIAVTGYVPVEIINRV
ncbi:MAG: GTPase HflX [Lachnospiraceae bacterium]|nr:GTPase HflX [Lachnospiraceae bacterium]